MTKLLERTHTSTDHEATPGYWRVCAQAPMMTSHQVIGAYANKHRWWRHTKLLARTRTSTDDDITLANPIFTGDPLHSRALAHSRAPLFTQPCPHCSHSRAPGEQWARLCVFTLQGCVQAARLCRGSPVIFLIHMHTFMFYVWQNICIDTCWGQLPTYAWHWSNQWIHTTP